MKKYALVTFALTMAALTTSVADGQHLVGGTCTGANTIPFWAQMPYYPQMRWQCLWRQDEIEEAGPITKIEWLAYPTTLYGGTFTGCKILLCHSSVATLTSTYANNYGVCTPVTLFDDDYTAPTPGGGEWATIIEPATTLNYNNTDNLLMEVSWTGYRGGGRNDYRCNSTSGYGGRVYASSATATTGTLHVNYSHYARITIDNFDTLTPTSLGRVKAMFD